MWFRKKKDQSPVEISFEIKNNAIYIKDVIVDKNYIPHLAELVFNIQKSDDLHQLILAKIQTKLTEEEYKVFLIHLNKHFDKWIEIVEKVFTQQLQSNNPNQPIIRPLR